MSTKSLLPSARNPSPMPVLPHIRDTHWCGKMGAMVGGSHQLGDSTSLLSLPQVCKKPPYSRVHSLSAQITQQRNSIYCVHPTPWMVVLSLYPEGSRERLSLMMFTSGTELKRFPRKYKSLESMTGNKGKVHKSHTFPPFFLISYVQRQTVSRKLAWLIFL